MDLPLSDGEKRLKDRLVAAEGTFAGRCEPIALGEDKTAGAAFGRGHLQTPAPCVEAEADMLKVAIDIFFPDVRLD